MKASEFATSQAEQKAAADNLIQTETTNAVNTGLVDSSDQAIRGLGRSARKVSIDNVSLAEDGTYAVTATKHGVFRNRTATAEFTGENVKELSEKQVRRLMAAKIHEGGVSSLEPAKQKAKATLKGAAIHGALQGSELDGADSLYYKGKGAMRLAKKGAGRLAGKKSLDDLAAKKARGKLNPRELMRKLQSRRNQAAAMKKAAEAKTAAAGAAKGSAAAGGAAASSGGGGVAAGCAGGCLLPLILGILALILFCTLLSAIIGGNNNSYSLSEVEIKVAQFFRDKGLDDIQIAGIMGNMYVESGMNPAKVQEDGGGRGICQWDGSRRDHLFSYAAMMQTDWTNLDLQLKFFWEEDEWKDNWSGSYEVSGGYDNPSPPPGTYVSGSKDGFLAADSVAEATEQFCYGWERAGFPRINERIAKAEEYYLALQSGLGSDSYVNAAIAIANDDSHGYSQAQRQLNPDVDCSSFVYYSLRNSGYTEDQLGGSYPFSTANMGGILEGCGFTRHDFTSVDNLQPGDILLRSGHTEIYIGNGKNAGAHSNYDGKAGDSSGDEVDIGNCSSNWTWYYRKG